MRFSTGGGTRYIHQAPNLSGVVPTGPIMKGLVLLVGPGWGFTFLFSSKCSTIRATVQK